MCFLTFLFQRIHSILLLIIQRLFLSASRTRNSTHVPEYLLDFRILVDSLGCKQNHWDVCYVDDWVGHLLWISRLGQFEFSFGLFWSEAGGLEIQLVRMSSNDIGT